MGINDWKELIDRRTANIGYGSKLGHFKPLTDAEKAAALAIEIQNWQASKGTRLKGWSIGESYADPLGSGINLKRTREPGGKLDSPEYQSALHMYEVTPMDHFGILKAQGVDVSKYEIPPTRIEKMIWKLQDWLGLKNDDEYEPPDRTRLTKEFMETFSVKEKK